MRRNKNVFIIMLIFLLLSPLLVCTKYCIPVNTRKIHDPSYCYFKDNFYIFGGYYSKKVLSGYNMPWPFAENVGFRYHEYKYINQDVFRAVDIDEVKKFIKYPYSVDISSNPWIKMGKIDNPTILRSSKYYIQHNGSIFVVGGMGYDPATNKSDSLEFRIYNDVWSSSDMVHWKKLANNATWSIKHGGRAHHELSNFEGYIYLTGGRPWNFLSAVYKDQWRSKDGISWEEVPQNADSQANRYLLEAASQNDPLGTAALLDTNADLNTKRPDGITALILASSYGYLEVVRALLDAKADVNSKSNDGVTALILASQENHLEIVRALLDAKADVNAKSIDGFTALIPAAQDGHHEVVRALLGANADVNAKSNNGLTALIQASQEGHLEVVRALLDAKADVNARLKNGATALIMASQEGHLEVVRALLNAKADVNAKAKNGCTALIMASQKGHTEVETQLKMAGAKE